MRCYFAFKRGIYRCIAAFLLFLVISLLYNAQSECERERENYNSTIKLRAL